MGNDLDKPSPLPYLKTEIVYNSLPIYEVKLLYQFGSDFKDIMSTYGTSNSICGYLAPVISLYISCNLTSFSDLPSIIENLNKPSIVVPLVEDSMKFIQNSRKMYVESQPTSECFTEKDKADYMKDWVANYEISDYMRSLNDNHKNQALKTLCFLRYVGLDQPESKDCKHEEKERLEEEKPFIGKKFFIESFHERRRLETVDEWKKANYIGNNKTFIFIADLNGHFVSFSFINSKDKNKCLILYDTTQGSYIDHEVVKVIAELLS